MNTDCMYADAKVLNPLKIPLIMRLGDCQDLGYIMILWCALWKKKEKIDQESRCQVCVKCKYMRLEKKVIRK